MEVDGEVGGPSGTAASQTTAMPLMKADTQQITKYQQLYSKVRECVEQTERDNFCLSEICDAVEESDMLLQPTSCKWVHIDPRLVLLDAKILNDATKAYKMTAEALDMENQKFDTVDFVDNLMRHVETNRNGWAMLESFVEKYFLPPVPQLSFMYGAFNFMLNTPQAQTSKAMRTANTVGNAIKPTKVITFDNEDVGIQAVLEHMTRVLVRSFRARGDRPVLYFKFSIDPHSFTRTVQNMFHVSFLVRDGLAALQEDKRGLPVLIPITKNTRTRKPVNSSKVNQLVSSITVPEWEKLVKVFRIKEPMLMSLEDGKAVK